MLGLTESTVSHYLTQLRNAGLVESERRGMNVFHRVHRDALAALCVVLRPQLLHLIRGWRRGDSEIGRSAEAAFHIGAFAAQETKGEVDPFDFTLPAFVLGSLASGDEIGFEVIEPVQHFGSTFSNGQRTQACSWIHGVA